MPRVNWKSSFGQITIEVLSIMLGVYLGLLVTQWSERQKERREKEQTRLSLIEEMQTNRERLGKVLPYHQMLRDSAWQIYNKRGTLPERPAFFRGLQVSSLPDGAYQTAILSESINLFSQKDIRAITDLYSFQRDYNEFAKLALSGLITQDMMREDNILQLARYIGITMTDIVGMEGNLIQSYQAVEQKLQVKK